MPHTKDKRPDVQLNPYTVAGFARSPISIQENLNGKGVALLSLRKVINIDGRTGDSQRGQRVGDRVFNMLFDAQEAEKKRISRELHDGLGQLLTSINLHVLQSLSASDPTAEVPQTVRESLRTISAMTKQAMGELRGICRALRPAILDDLGVEAAINWQCRQIAAGDDSLRVTTDFQVHEAMIPEDYKTAIYRIVQEALNNTVKYAEAENISIKLYHAGNYLQLIIEDDGVGFDPEQIDAAEGIGLSSMRDRSEAIGGVFHLQSNKGEGVEIRVLLPLEKATLSG